MVVKEKRLAASAAASQPKRTKRAEGLYEKYKGKAIPAAKLPRGRTPAGALKAICWNVGGLHALVANHRQLQLQKLVRDEKPELLGFLEHKLQEGEQVQDMVEKLRELLPDYEAAAFSCSKAKKGYSGVAVLRRKSRLVAGAKVTCPKLEKGPDEGRTVCVELQKCFVVFCYVPNSGDGLVRLKERLGNWDSKLRTFLRGLAKRKPVLLLGDMNVAHLDADIWNLEAPHVPKSAATTPEERASFGKLLEAGFVDGFAHLHPEAMGAFTYWSVRAGNRKPNRGLRLDYAVVTKDLAQGKGKARLADAFHLPAFAPSGDHCPVGATLVGV